MVAYGEPSTSGRLRERGAGSAAIPPKISLAVAARGRPRHARGAVPRWARRIIAVRAGSAGARVSFRIIASRCEAHRSIARAKPVLGGRVRAGGGMPGAGRRARATCLFNDVQMAISQLLAARGAARHRRRRQSLDLGLGRVGRGPTPPEGRSLRGHPGAPRGRLTRPRRVACEIYNNCCNLFDEIKQTAITAKTEAETSARTSL